MRSVEKGKGEERESERERERQRERERERVGWFGCIGHESEELLAAGAGRSSLQAAKRKNVQRWRFWLGSNTYELMYGR